MTPEQPTPRGWLSFLIDARPVVFVAALVLVFVGGAASPFASPWVDALGLPSIPVSASAFPDVGDNQQIITARWDGAAPIDVEDQLTLPLSTALLGVSGVQSVRASSTFGLSTVYVLFDDDVTPDLARSRLAQTLLSLDERTLPPEVRPMLGPDANALGQVYWYALETHDEDGNITPAFDLHELRTLQDDYVGPALAAVHDVAEVAAIGGHVVEWWVEADPETLRANGLTLDDLARAASDANQDLGARSMELQQAEYLVRGVGRIESLSELESASVTSTLTIGDIAHVGMGPAERRGILDDSGAEVVGGIVTIRQGANPREVITRVREAVDSLSASLPSREVDGQRVSVRIVPFYDRAELVEDTLDTLSSTLWHQLLITLLVVLVMMRNLRGGLLVALVPPLGILATWMLMRAAGIEANAMALAGIAIAIGSMVDIGIVLADAAQHALDESAPDEDGRAHSSAERARRVGGALREVFPSVATSVGTTIVAFLPVLALSDVDGKLFRPLAWTKTFALLGALGVAAILVPALTAMLLRRREPSRARDSVLAAVAIACGVLLIAELQPLPSRVGSAALVAVLLVSTLLGFALFHRGYSRLLRLALERKALFGLLPAALLALGALCLWGLPGSSWFPGLRRAQMPEFDEGAFLYMPVTMPHASIGTGAELLSWIDQSIAAIPEVDRVVGKLGRADTALDPAPIAMFEVLITLKPEYGERDGERARLWRPEIRTQDDVWDEIARAADHPGLTRAPPLQPIATRQLMLRTGMRARIGVALQGPSSHALHLAGRAVEAALLELPELDASSVQAEQTDGKPYLEVHIDRPAAHAAGVRVSDVQRTLRSAVGGLDAGRVLQGRSSVQVRVRAVRDARQSPHAIEELVVPTTRADQGFVRLGDVAEVRYSRGPQSLRTEDTFLTRYVTFDAADSLTDTEVVRVVEERLGRLTLPQGVSWRLRGAFERELRTSSELRGLVPLALCLIFLLLYLQFRDVWRCVFIFVSVLVSAAGGFIALGIFGASPWPDALNVALGSGPVHLTVAVWVGFIALAGIAVDDGVLLTDLIQREIPGSTTRAELRDAVVRAGSRRIRACLMTTATTLLALLPVLLATGRGSDVMRPMAIPLFGGMVVELITLFVVPVLNSWRAERRLPAGPTAQDG